MSKKFERARVRVKGNYDTGGRLGWQIGPEIYAEQWWIPVLWDDDEDPDCFKKVGLNFLDHGQEQRELRQNILDIVTDLVSKFMYYNREEEDDTLSVERLEQAFKDGVITHEEVAAHFLKELKGKNG
ncbi:hypothetical protein LCGC14_0164360 [marine sediment metagenome]|uniref:Uncharacterized protein n=1 Tax=marine sediment metagenome TaxID=412755 RepID=A0A0F9VAM6_9ZZZZ